MGERERNFEREGERERVEERDSGRERKELVMGRRSSPEFCHEKWRSTAQVDVRQRVRERETSLSLLY